MRMGYGLGSVIFIMLNDVKISNNDFRGGAKKDYPGFESLGLLARMGCALT